MLSTSQSPGAERRTPSPVSPRGVLFSGYALDHAYDEMFDASRHARPHCRPLFEDLLAASLPQLRQHQTEADKAFLTQGITFTVYGDEAGTERILPYDLLPRIITAAEWATIERGLTQRLTAINLFLRDIYHEGRILSEGIVPRDLVYSCRHYRREMRGVHTPATVVSMRPTSGLGRAAVIYPRVDDDFLDPLAFRPASRLGVPGLLNAYRAGNVSLGNAIGTGVADDKAIYAYVPEIIRFYLSEEPVLPNVETYLMGRPSDRQYALEHLDELVVKAVGESGGYGMLIGPHSTAMEREAFRNKILAEPRNFIAQPTLSLSRAPCLTGDRIQPPHIDLRPYVLYGDRVSIMPCGLPRAALR